MTDKQTCLLLVEDDALVRMTVALMLEGFLKQAG